jgi:hypothetical protein
MRLFVALILFATTIFNVVTWPAFFRRVVNDPRAHDEQGRKTSFYRVHLVLLIIALDIALASAIAGFLLLTTDLV